MPERGGGICRRAPRPSRSPSITAACASIQAVSASGATPEMSSEPSIRTPRARHFADAAVAQATAAPAAHWSDRSARRCHTLRASAQAVPPRSVRRNRQGRAIRRYMHRGCARLAGGPATAPAARAGSAADGAGSRHEAPALAHRQMSQSLRARCVQSLRLRRRAGPPGRSSGCAVHPAFHRDGNDLPRLRIDARSADRRSPGAGHVIAPLRAPPPPHRRW